MAHSFREVRKGECEAVIAFAKERGCVVRAEQLRHHLSLTIQAGGAITAAALCLETSPGRYTIQIVPGDETLSEDQVRELTDRCLRKMQATDIGAARIQSPAQEPTRQLWSQANWLDRIDETPPNDSAAPGQAA